MEIIHVFLKAFFILVALVAIAFASLTFYGWERVWMASFGPADLGSVTFEGLKRDPKPNQALICPANLCSSESVDQDSPVYAVAADRLREELLKSLEEEADLERVDNKADLLKLRFVQRTEWMRFPDTIRVAILPIDENTSTLAIYSQSQIGESDFGVNLERTNRWLSRLEKFEQQPSSHAGSLTVTFNPPNSLSAKLISPP